MKVLFAVWELDPLIKVGGLGDVARSLPAALRAIGVDIRVVLPFYKAIHLGKSKKTKVGSIQFSYDGETETVQIFHLLHPDNQVPIYLLSHPRYLSTPGFPDTFAFFNAAIVQMISARKLSFTPDIIHCNDLHTSLIPLLMREMKIPIKTLLTIHNLAYQGHTSTEILEKLGIEKSKSRIVQWEIKSKQVNFLLEGIAHADIVTTVSPTYAKEIMTEEFGVGLEEVLRGKEGRVFGILNGIDNGGQIWHMKHVKYPYISEREKRGTVPPSVHSWQEGKKLNKAYLQKKLGLKRDSTIPLLGFIGRFDPFQKGIDILHKMLRGSNLKEYQLAVLGSGNHEWEERFQWLSTFYPESVSCTFTFDEALAHQIYAATDFMLVPSKFEPCGLIQMIAMYFGSLPIVHKTGGLIDSVKDGYNGFVFEKYTAEAMQKEVGRAIDIWKHKKSVYREMVAHAFNTDFSWDKSAQKYLELYKSLMNN